MKSCYLDSNFLVYWQTDKSPQHNIVLNKLVKLRKQEIAIFISPLVIDELIHTIIVEARLNNVKDFLTAASKALNDLLELPNLTIINPPIDFTSQQKIISLMSDFNLRPRDAYHLLIMQANQIDGFATFDNDFKKVFAAKIITKA